MAPCPYFPVQAPRSSIHTNLPEVDANHRNNATCTHFEIGDSVLVQQLKHNKLSTRFNRIPYHIIHKRGTMLIAINHRGHYITRNASHFKHFHTDSDRHFLSDNEEEDNLIDFNTTQAVEQNAYNAEPQRYPERNRRPAIRFGNNIYDT